MVGWRAAAIATAHCPRRLLCREPRRQAGGNARAEPDSGAISLNIAQSRSACDRFSQPSSAESILRDAGVCGNRVGQSERRGLAVAAAVSAFYQYPDELPGRILLLPLLANGRREANERRPEFSVQLDVVEVHGGNQLLE